MFSLVLVLSLTVVIPRASPKKGASGQFTTIDDYVEAQRVRLGIPGLALGIVHGDQIVHLKGFGVTGASGQPVTAQTPFHIGSVTKSFTALAVMQLVEAGKIDMVKSPFYLRKELLNCTIPPRQCPCRATPMLWVG